MFMFDGSHLIPVEEHRLTKSEERLVIFARRLFATRGAQASDCLRSDFGIEALLQEKSRGQIEYEKANSDLQMTGDEKEDAFRNLMRDYFRSPKDDEESEPEGEEKASNAGDIISDPEFREALRAIGRDSARDLVEKVMNTRFHLIPELVNCLVAQCIAIGYVIGRDEKKVVSGEYDKELDQMDRLSAIAELDGEVELINLALAGKTDMPEELLIQVEERKDVISIMRRYIDNNILSMKQIRDICDKTQFEHILIVSRLPFLSEVKLVDKIEEKLGDAEEEVRKLKSTLEKSE